MTYVKIYSETSRDPPHSLSSGSVGNILPIVLTLDECLELIVFDLAKLHVNLEGQQEGEEELVILIQTTGCVLEHLIRHEFNDVSNTLGRYRTLLGPVNHKSTDTYCHQHPFDLVIQRQRHFQGENQWESKEVNKN